jgi:hypothetical protein
MGPDFDADIEKEVDKAIKDFAVDDPGQWSRFEYPVAAVIISRASRRIEEAIDRFRSARGDPEPAVANLAAVPKQKWELPQTPVVGTLATGQITAQAQFTPEGYPLILIENGLFKLADLIAALALVGSSETSQMGLSSATLQLAADIAAAHCVIGATMGVYERNIPPAFREMVPVVSQYITSFVIAHEYAHIVRGDLKVHQLGSNDRAAIPVGEFDADDMAFRICLLAERRPGFEGAPVFGSILYLAMLDFLARVEAAFEGRDPPPDVNPEYPTPNERMYSLLSRLQSSWLGTALEDAIHPAVDTYRFMRFLGDLVVPIMVQARDELSTYVPTGNEGSHEMEMLHGAVVQVMWRYGKAAHPNL